MERWLLERGYKEKELRKQVLRGRAICRDDLLNREKTLQEKTQVTFNLTYYPVFKKAESQETFDILKGPLDCNSNNVIYLFECKKCQFKFPYVGSTVTKFRFRFNNYKSTHRKFRKKLKKGIVQEIKKSELKQKLFHEHYCSDGHDGFENWCVTLIDQVEDKKELRKKELYWINKLNTWAPVGLNVREVYEAY